MAVDTSIYSNIRPFTMTDPMDTAMKGMALGEAQRKFTLEDDISKALSESGGDYSKASQALAAKGRGTAAMSLSDKAEAQKKGQLEQHLKKMEAMASDGIALDAAYRQALQANGGDPQKAIAAIAPAYNDVRSRWAPQGVNLPETFDPVKNLAGVGQAKEVASYLKTLTPQKSELGKLVGERDALPAGDQRRTAYEEAIKKHSAATPTELARLTAERDALPQGDAKRADYDRVIAQYKAGRGTEVNVTTEKKYGEQFAGKIAEADATMRDAAIKAPEIANRANDVLKVLSSGKTITGSGAEARLSIGKALGLAGASDEETVSNTEQLAVSLAQNTLDAIKASGLGSGSGFSNADRDFLEKAVGGKITLEERTIKRLATLAHRAGQRSAEKWNSRLQEIPDSALEGTGIKRTPIEVPAMHTSSAPTSSNPREVVLPNGVVKSFPTPAAAQRFREEAGL